MSEFRPAPKPSPRQPKVPTPIKRSRLKKQSRPKAETLRIYGSVERRLWMKAQPCCVCEAFGLTQEGESHNAHTETGGTSYKADARTIVPMCRLHHQMFDEHRDPLDAPEIRDMLKKLAAKYDALWQTFPHD